MGSSDYFREVASHFLRFRNSEFLCDTILVSDDRELKAHSLLLAASSPVFKSTFEKSGEPGLHYIYLPGYSSKVVEIALSVIYTGDLVLTEEFQDDEAQVELFTALQNLGLELQGMNTDCTLELDMDASPMLPSVDSSAVSNSTVARGNCLSAKSNRAVAKNCEKFPEMCVKQEKNSTVDLESALEITSEGIARNLVPLERHELDEVEENVRPDYMEQDGAESKQILEEDSTIEDEDEDETSLKKLYVCNLCNKTFTNLNFLEIHKRTHTGEKPFECNICGRQFSQRANLNRHTLGHLGDKPNLCHICGKTFIQKTQLDDHLLQHNDAGVCICRICSEAFRDRVLLRQHVMRAHPKGQPKPPSSDPDSKPNVCETCGKSYSTIGGLRMHARIHTGEVVTCTTCDKAFVNQALLLQHMRGHTKEKTYECTTCGKMFVYKNALTVHTRVHTGEKPYRCSSCGHTYSQFGHLQAHKKTHTGEKPFTCGFCDKAYKQKVDLRIHMNRVHQVGTEIKLEMTPS